MLHFSIIGNIAADAEVKQFSSGDFVSFRVAHNFRDGDKDRTQWVSCLMRGNGGKLIDYLKKGSLVYVTGRGAARTFSSQITKQFEVGLDCHVDRLELLSNKPKISVEAIKKAIDDKAISLDELKPLFNDLPF